LPQAQSPPTDTSKVQNIHIHIPLNEGELKSESIHIHMDLNGSNPKIHSLPVKVANGNTTATHSRTDEGSYTNGKQVNGHIKPLTAKPSWSNSVSNSVPNGVVNGNGSTFITNGLHLVPATS